MNNASWSLTNIVANCFGKAYGEHGWVAALGDPFSLTLYETPGKIDPQTSKGGRLP